MYRAVEVMVNPLVQMLLPFEIEAPPRCGDGSLWRLSLLASVSSPAPGPGTSPAAAPCVAAGAVVLTVTRRAERRTEAVAVLLASDSTAAPRSRW